MALRFECGFEAAEEVVEGSAQLGEFVVGAGEGEALVQVGGGDLLGCGGDGAEGPQEPAGEPPGDRDRDHQSVQGDERCSDSDFYPTLAPGGYHHSGGSFVISGSGDIAPGVVAGIIGASTPASTMLLGLIVGRIVMIVVASLFIAAEYRRGLIRTTFTATPHRGRCWPPRRA